MGYMLPFSMQDCHDHSGHRVFDARLHIFRVEDGAVAPAYADTLRDTRHPTPVLMRSGGIWPQIYLEPGAYRLRITDPRGYIYDQIDGLVVPAEGGGSGGGGGGTVDDKRLAQTGDIKDRYGVGTHPGWVRLNGRTIGSAASSATERANDDCEALFAFLWTRDPALAVSGGRGANAASDWAAAKTIALPDQRGRGRFALDDLGSTAAGRLTGGLFAVGNATTLGGSGGEASHAQTPTEMPSHNHAVTATMGAAGGHSHNGTTGSAGAHIHEVPYQALAVYRTQADGEFGVSNVGAADPNFTGYAKEISAHAHSFTTSEVAGHRHSLSASCGNRGSGSAMNWLPPFLLISTYIRL